MSIVDQIKNKHVAEKIFFYNIKIDNYGNYIATGYSENNGNNNAIIVKFDNKFNILNSKIYNIDNYSNNVFYNVTVDNGNYVAVGCETLKDQEYNNAFIVKFDQEFNILNSKIYNHDDDSAFFSIEVDGHGDYIAVGYIELKGKMHDDALIVKFDNELNVLNSKIYRGNRCNYFYDIAVDQLGNYVAVGYSLLESHDYYNAMIVKFDNNLNKLYDKIYGGTRYDEFSSIAIDNDGNYVAVGYTSSEKSGNTNALIMKFDQYLNIMDIKTYGGTGIEYFISVTVDNDGNYVAVGYTDSKNQSGNDSLIVKFDDNLNILAAETYNDGNDSFFSGIAVDSNDYIIIKNNENKNKNDTVILKINSLFSEPFTLDSEYALADGKLTLVKDNLTLSSVKLTATI